MKTKQSITTTKTTSKVETKQLPHGKVETVTQTTETKTDMPNNDIEKEIFTRKTEVSENMVAITETTGKVITTFDKDAYRYTGRSGTATIKRMVQYHYSTDDNRKTTTNITLSTTTINGKETGMAIQKEVIEPEGIEHGKVTKLESHDEIELYINKLFY